MTDAALKELTPSLPETLDLPHFDLLHYLLSESEGQHVAHCLDIDLVAVGKSQTEAAVRLDRLVKAHIEYALATGEMASLKTRAPQSFWKQFLDGTRIALDPTVIHIQIPGSVQVVPIPVSELPILAHAA